MRRTEALLKASLTANSTERRLSGGMDLAVGSRLGVRWRLTYGGESGDAATVWIGCWIGIAPPVSQYIPSLPGGPALSPLGPSLEDTAVVISVQLCTQCTFSKRWRTHGAHSTVSVNTKLTYLHTRAGGQMTDASHT